ncbi:unnamed protein product [Vicia faba]|uniref:Armadillo repeat-containing protein 8 n=1 Tax=Vicia faba TaxID=3906 RepID=A0AAV0YGG7_VICFA|nr:unnamed protein product [Vicia faba]
MWRETVCVVVVWVIRRWMMQRGSLCLRRCGYDPTRAPLWLVTVTSYARWLVGGDIMYGVDSNLYVSVSRKLHQRAPSENWYYRILLLMTEKLVGGLDGSMSQRDASLESIATILKNNPGAVSKFVELQNGRALRSVAALGAISNIVVDFTPNKSTIIQCGGIKELVHLTKSMDSSLRLNAVWSLRNMIFLADKMCKDAIFMELTASSVATLICDPEPSVQEQALALVRNFVDGCMDCVEFAFAENGIILDAVGRQLKKSPRIEIIIQGMYAVSNIASGNEFHKEAIMQMIFPQAESGPQSFLSQYLQSNDSRLRTSAAWIIVNLTAPASPGAFGRIAKLRNFGLVAQIKRMASDPCMDVKLRARVALGQIISFGDS